MQKWLHTASRSQPLAYLEGVSKNGVRQGTASAVPLSMAEEGGFSR
jgi:hypothetical protein